MTQSKVDDGIGAVKVSPSDQQGNRFTIEQLRYGNELVNEVERLESALRDLGAATAPVISNVRLYWDGPSNGRKRMRVQVPVDEISALLESAIEWHQRELQLLGVELPESLVRCLGVELPESPEEEGNSSGDETDEADVGGCAMTRLPDGATCPGAFDPDISGPPGQISGADMQ